MRSLQPIAKVGNRKPSLKASRLVRDLKKQADSYKTAVESQNKKMLELDRRIDQQNDLINEQNARLAEQEEKLAQMSRRLSENTSQFTGMDKGKRKISTKIDVGMSMHPACSRSSSLSAITCETLPRIAEANSRSGEDESPSRPRKRVRSEELKVFKSYLEFELNYNKIFNSSRRRQWQQLPKDLENEEAYYASVPCPSPASHLLCSGLLPTKLTCHAFVIHLLPILRLLLHPRVILLILLKIQFIDYTHC